MKKLVALMTFLCMAVMMPGAAALELPEQYIEVDIPSDFTVMAGDRLDERDALVEQIGEDELPYLSDIGGESVVFSAVDTEQGKEITFTAVQNDFSLDVFDMRRVDQEFRDDVIKGDTTNNAGVVFGVSYNKARYFEHEQALFIRYDITWNLGWGDIQEIKYYTIQNGINYTFTLYGWKGSLSEDDEQMMAGMISGLSFTQLLSTDKEFSGELQSEDDGSMLTTLLIAIGAVGLMFVIFNLPDWRDAWKKRKKQ